MTKPTQNTRLMALVVDAEQYVPISINENQIPYVNTAKYLGFNFICETTQESIHQEKNEKSLDSDIK